MAKRKNNTLTDPQKETLKAICDFIDEKGYPPMIKELGAILGIKYSSTMDRLRNLLKKGYIERDKSARSIRVLRRLDAPRTRFVSFPLVGTVVAGMPVLAEENREGIILLECNIENPEGCFALRANGESMIDVGINTGDILIVRQQFLASDGDIVIATVNNESTVKTLRYVDNQVVLMPENRAMKPIKVKDTDDFRIQGVVLFWRSIG